MKTKGIFHAILQIGLNRIFGVRWSPDDLQEWIHLHNYCRDPYCPFLLTERGEKFTHRQLELKYKQEISQRAAEKGKSI